MFVLFERSFPFWWPGWVLTRPGPFFCSNELKNFFSYIWFENFLLFFQFNQSFRLKQKNNKEENPFTFFSCSIFIFETKKTLFILPQFIFLVFFSDSYLLKLLKFGSPLDKVQHSCFFLLILWRSVRNYFGRQKVRLYTIIIS